MYALETPWKRKQLNIPEDEKIAVEPRGANSDQSHRIFEWLHHKPQAHAIFPKPMEFSRFQKK